MKNILKIIKKNIFSIVLGILIFGTIGVTAAIMYDSKDVVYDNSLSGSSATTVQDAIDDLYNRAKNSNDYSLGTLIYFNPETGKMCNNYTPNNSLNENKSGCMKWYVINTSVDGVDLLLDHNTTYGIAWNASGSNANGPDTTFLNKLKSDTSSWNGVPTRTDSFVDPANNYTINYNGYKARLIEANEIWNITKSTNGKTNWDSATSTHDFYFDGSSLSGQGTSKYPWLYDYTYHCTSYGCNIKDDGTYGYWTSSSIASFSGIAWYVICDGTLLGLDVDSTDGGVRPVITLPKSLFEPSITPKAGSYTEDFNINISKPTGYLKPMTYKYCLSRSFEECIPDTIIPDGGKTININNDGLYRVNYRVCVNTKGEGINKTECSGTYELIKNNGKGQDVYFNPKTGKKCTNYVANNSLNQNKSGCMKWYIIGGTGNNVDLLLDHNTTYKIKWNTSKSNANGPDTTFLNKLKSDTSSWNGVSTRTDSYIDPAHNYTINYNGYKARLIEANEIWDITKSTNGQTNWDSATAQQYRYFYFEGSELNGQGTSKYPWLYDYIYNCTSNGCNIKDEGTYGYWTSSSFASSSISAWYVYYRGTLDYGGVDYADHGVRPVITVSKSKL